MFVLLNNLDNASNNTRCVSSSNQKFEIQATFTNLHNEYRQKFHFFPFVVKLDRVLEVVILLMSYVTNFLLQIKLKI